MKCLNLSIQILNFVFSGIMEAIEAAAQNCTLTMEHIEALNLTHDISMIAKLYNMCEYTWDPEKTWSIYFWKELIPPLVVYMQVPKNSVMPCPFTGPKMFCAGPNVLCQTKNLFTYKKFGPAQNILGPVKGLA